MRLYNFSTLGGSDEYGQPQVTEAAEQIKIAIYPMTQSIVDNIKYKDCTFIGLTTDKLINDTYIIKYDNTQLKVLYINPKGRFSQVYLKEI